jgi:hypothetical protein
MPAQPEASLWVGGGGPPVTSLAGPSATAVLHSRLSPNKAGCLPKAKEAVEKIVAVVSPYLGETMAQAAARAHCQKLGIVVDGSEITREQLDALVKKVAQGLNIFVGREKAAIVVQQIHAAMAAGSS